MISFSPQLGRVLLLWFAGLGAAAQFGKIAVPFASFRALYPEMGTEVGWLLSLISLMGALLGIVAGGMVGRFGAKNVLLVGLAFGALLSLWQASLPSFVPMLVSRVLEGASHLAIVVAAPTLIVQQSTPAYRGAAMTLWSTFFGVSFSIIAWGIMPLIGAEGLDLLFLGHGAFMLVITILLALCVPASSGHVTQSQGEATPKPLFSVRSAVTALMELHLRSYRSPWILAPGAGWLLYTLTFVSLLALLPDGLPSAQAALAVGLMPLVSIAVSLLVVPLLLRRWSSIEIVMLGFGGAAALVAINLVWSMPLAFAVSLFAVLGLVQGASFAAVPELNQAAPDQALSYGCMAQAGNTGNLLGTPLLLAVSSGFGGDGMLVTIGLLYLAGIVVHRGLTRQRARKSL